MTSERVVAVDWSGRAGRAATKSIWLAEVRDGSVLRLENGRSREDIGTHLVELADEDPDLVVGLDFSFSLPAWFLVERGFTSAVDLWHVPDEEREGWLRCEAPPFWGLPGRPRPELPEHLRRTEARLSVGGIRPKSTFQVSGAGSVGAGSVRGFPVLASLRSRGFSIWPFDDATAPAVVEMWPRLLTGPVVKSRRDTRTEYLSPVLRDPDHLDAALPDWARRRAEESDDAFDALVSAIVMARHADQLRALRRRGDRMTQLEGAIWTPEARSS